MFIRSKWVTGHPTDDEVSALETRESDPFVVIDLAMMAVLVPLMSGLALRFGYATLEQWLVVSGVVVIICLTGVFMLLKKERAAHKVYDRFAKAGRIHSIRRGSPLYYLCKAVNDDFALLKRNPEKVDDFLTDVAVQKAYNDLVNNPDLIVKAAKIIEIQANACAKVIRELDS